jgi:hypothetical protein
VVAISTDGSVSSSITRRFLVLIAAFPLPVTDRFLLAGAGSTGGRGDEVLSRLGMDTRSTVEPGDGAREASGMGGTAAVAGRGDEALSRLGGETRSMVEAEAGAREASGTGYAAAAGALLPARTERREPTGHSRQPRSSMSRAASSVESAAAAAGATPGGGEVALRETVERRGRMRSTDLSRSTITG